MRRTYVWRDGRMIEVIRQPAKPRVHIIGDTMPATFHPGTRPGEKPLVYESKSSFRRTTKERGLVEYGNDDPTQGKWEPTVVDVREAVEKAYRRVEYKNDDLEPVTTKGSEDDLRTTE